MASKCCGNVQIQLNNATSTGGTGTGTGSISSLVNNGDGTYTHNDGNGGTPVTFDLRNYAQITMYWAEGTLTEDNQYTPDYQTAGGVADVNQSGLLWVADPSKTGGEFISAHIKINNPVTQAGTVTLEKVSGGTVTTIVVVNVPVSAANAQVITTAITGQTFANGDYIRYNTEDLLTADNLSANLVINYLEN
jgi:hypothetical protein